MHLSARADGNERPSKCGVLMHGMREAYEEGEVEQGALGLGAGQGTRGVVVR